MLSLLILCACVTALVGFGFWTRGRNVRNARAALSCAMTFAFLALVMSATAAFAAESPEASGAASNGLGLIGAALSTGLACIGAGIGVAFVGAAALGVVGEKPALFGTTLIYMGLAEGIAIYGLVISLFILGRV
ncbi:ATPase [Synergistales bacterium]|nr:ATPase [Synergistales bacterium]